VATGGTINEKRREALRAIVFDLDATLYDDPRLGDAVHAETYRYLAEEKGLEPAAAENLLQQTKRRLTTERGSAGTLSLAIGELGLDLHELHRRFAERLEPADYLPRDERVVTLLQDLAKRYDLVVYTNNNRTLSAKIMQVLGIAEQFSRIFTIEDTWQPKPDRGTLEMILTAIGRQPAECLFVGDRYDIDLRLPQEMGAKVFLVADLTDLLRLGELDGNAD
jgi:putative hydrolase of the HAD superfamily